MIGLFDMTSVDVSSLCPSRHRQGHTCVDPTGGSRSLDEERGAELSHFGRFVFGSVEGCEWIICS
jgi:hypothetical protein